MTDWQRWFQDTVTRSGDSVAASHYDSQRSFRVRQRAVLGWLGPVRSQTIVDVGPGAGHFCAPLTAHNRVIGVDFVPQMLHYAANKGLLPTQGDALNLPLASHSADAVICVGVLQHIDPHSALLRELLRVCRPDGAVYLVTLNRDSLVRGLYYRLTRAPEIMHTYRMTDLMDELTPLATVNAAPIYYPLPGFRRVRGRPGLSRYLSTAFALRIKPAKPINVS